MRVILASLMLLLSQVLSAFSPPLKTHGAGIYDRAGEKFQLHSVNWYGPHMERQVVEGLEHQKLPDIVKLIKEAGFNSVRLPFSNQMLRDHQPVSPEWLAANEDLIGLSPLEVFDKTIEALTQEGLAVILNNHTTYSEWCCNYDRNGLWFSEGLNLPFPFSTQDWEQDFLMLVDRYRDNPLVVGMDLRNEVRTMPAYAPVIPRSPNWGHGGKTDWYLASKTLGNKILAKNPDLLIIVEGINWTGLVPILGSGFRPTISGVKDKPIHLQVPQKLVYAAHNYSYTGPRHPGKSEWAKGPSYSEMTPSEFKDVIDFEWNFVTKASQYYTAPVWISEFGLAPDANEQDSLWFKNLLQILKDEDLGYAYWPLNHERYGLVNEDWSELLDDWRIPLIKELNKSNSSPSKQQHIFSSVDLRHTDDLQDPSLYDWLPGSLKASCPKNWYLVGLSQDFRGLCLKGSIPLHTNQIITEENSLEEDWAIGMTKLSCPQGSIAKGFAKNIWGATALQCQEAPLSETECLSLRMDQGDHRISSKGGDFAQGSRKSQCSLDSAITGIAHRHGKITAVRCCKLHNNH